MARSQLRGFDGRFVANGAGVEWQGLEVLSNWYSDRGVAMHEYRIATAEQLALTMEDYAKANASWEDRTGDARDSLKAVAVHGVDVSTVSLGYGPSIFYGYYLENFVYSGVSYAIIGPTIDFFKDIMFQGIQ